MTTEDSAGYVTAALADIFYVYRPFGYSWLLQFIHGLSSNIFVVFALQHLLHFISVVFFIFTIAFFLSPKRNIIYYIFLILCSFTPCYFYMSNSLLSDSLFTSLTTLWLTTAIWIVLRPALFTGILHAILLFWLLHTRYIAFCYPFISFILFIWLLKKKSWLPILLSGFAIIIFYNQTCSSMQHIIGKRQFSTGFSGWQTANNALHVIPYIDLKIKDLPDRQLQLLHRFILPQKDEIANMTASGPTAIFMWNKNMPLKQYMAYTMQQNHSDYLKSWVNAGTDFGKYGQYLIIHYPFSYLQHYFLPNLWNAFHPTPESYSLYNFKQVAKETVHYYQLKPNIDASAQWDFMKILSPYIPWIYLGSWVIIFSILIIALFYCKKIKFQRNEKIIFWFLLSFGITYMGAVTYGSPVVARYFLPLVCIKGFVIYLLISHLFIIRQNKTNVTEALKN